MGEQGQTKSRAGWPGLISLYFSRRAFD